MIRSTLPRHTAHALIGGMLSLGLLALALLGCGEREEAESAANPPQAVAPGGGGIQSKRVGRKLVVAPSIPSFSVPLSTIYYLLLTI